MAPSVSRRSKVSALLLPLLSGSVHANLYGLSESYSGSNFFNNWNFATSDPSGGWVTYVDQGTAQNNGYISTSSNGAYVGVDYTSTLSTSGAGRKAVRLESKATFNKGLFIGDFSHMPTGCGLWPAFWMVGPNWPNDGEIDIIEGVNTQATDQISGHTSNGCTIAGGDSTATLDQSVCYQPSTNSGCYFVSGDKSAFGTGFNNAGGGVYAMEWTDAEINVWGWSRGSVPGDIAAERPDTGTWGTPLAQFAGGGCNIDSHFADMTIVINTDFCGPWAGAVYGSMGCPGSSCNDYVATNPSAFKNAFWQINSVNIYQPSSGSNATSAASKSYTSVVPLASLEPIYAPDSGMGRAEVPTFGPPAEEGMRPRLAGRFK